MLNRIKWRLVIIFSFFILMLGVVPLRIILIQNDLKDTIVRSVKSDVVTFDPKLLPRPILKDRSGIDLAISVPRRSLWLNPKALSDDYLWAKKLEKVLDIPASRLIQEWQTTRRFVWVKRLIKSDLEKILRDLNLPKAFGWVTEYERVYPFGPIFEPVIGLTGIDHQGLSNLEWAIDSLQPWQQEMPIMKDGAGRIVRLSWDLAQRLVDTPFLQMTIDAEMQVQVYHTLRRVLNHHQAKQAFAMAVDVATGEVLVASWVRADNQTFYKNPFLSDLFEWGSIVKPLFIYQSLKNGVVSENLRWNVGDGRLKVGKHTIHDSHVWQKELDLKQALVVSSNVVMAQVALKWDSNRFEDALKEFGFDDKPKIQTPFGEWIVGHRSLRKRGKLSSIDKVVLSFGQGMGLSVWHVMRSYLILLTGNPRANLCWFRDCPPQSELMMDQYAHWVFEAMKEVTESPHGTGRQARLPGLSVAGKTGTAQKPRPHGKGYQPGKYLASFIGVAPWPHPRFLLLVGVDEPQVNGYYGGQVAAPAWREIMGILVRLSQVKNPTLAFNLIDRNDNLLTVKDHELASSVNSR